MTARSTPKKHRRARGSGSVYQLGRVWWISYHGPDGKRVAESTESPRKGDAERLLEKRIGSREHHLPMVKYAERLTFDAAAKAVVDDYTANGRKSVGLQRRIRLHLRPVFGGRRMAGITSAKITAFIAKRQGDVIITRKAHKVTDAKGTTTEVEAVTQPVTNAEINRELQLLKRCFSLAIEQGLLAMKPKIKMLKESDPRSGFFERQQFATLIAHLDAEIRPVIQFAFYTGWRMYAEVLKLEWRNVDFDAGEVRLDVGTTKSGEGRRFPFANNAELRAVLEAQHVVHEEVKKAGHITPLVFFRMTAKDHGEPKPKAITSFTKAWRNACRAAGCPGFTPHDLRRTAIRNLVRAGVPESVAMKLSGHKTRSVFDRYNITSDDDLRDAVGKLDAAQKRGVASR